MASNRGNAAINNEFSKMFENIEKIIGQCLMEKNIATAHIMKRIGFLLQTQRYTYVHSCYVS